MTQTFKTVYLQGHPASDAKKRHIRLAFGQKEDDLYEVIKTMTSEEIRQLLGISNFEDLKSYAADRALSINRACISLLHQAIQPRHENTPSPQVQEWNISDPLIATYRGSTDDVCHGWYPLLEGYSSRFVEAVLDTYAPHANLVLDPFSGGGSTPLTVAMRGLTGYYCELNPIFQFVCSVKAKALQSSDQTRSQLIDLLREEAFGIPFRLGIVEPDLRLEESYYNAFGESKFFVEETFEEVLRLRTLADELEARSPILGQLFTLAVLASLVPVSLLKRAGDLRYKTEREMAKGPIAIREEVSRRLNQMANDLGCADLIVGQTIQVLEDARHLISVPSMNVDAVITSPPYLNGTNYFRNTKIELWFIRAVKSQGDLAYFRRRAVTAGINDVTKDKNNQSYPPEAVDIVKRLSQVAYDPRIPLMVGGYFKDMEEVLGGVAKHVAPGGKVAIDIGDSRYAGLHIETDSILSSIASRLGFNEVAIHTLRLRRSRDTSTLRQSLIVLEWPSVRRWHSIERRYTLPRRWTNFKAKLPHQIQPYSKRNWGHPLHSLCSYQGKMKPSIAYFLVKAFVPDGGTVLDPFAGVGTIPFEACLQGKRAYGFDISPAAVAITTAKLEKPNPARVHEIIDELGYYLETNIVSPEEQEATYAVNFNRSLSEYYHPRTLDEIILAREFFKGQQITDVNVAMVLSCLLHILHGNRPYALSRRSHPITPFTPSGEFEYKPLIGKLQEKVGRSIGIRYPMKFVNGSAYFQDATSWWPREIENIDALITSPPFFDSTRFYLANWIRLWFCGWDRDDFSLKPLRFVDSRQKETMRIYETVFRQAKERLRPNGVLVLHLGNSTKCDMAKELIAVARPFFRVADQFEESVLHTESHGVTDKGKVTGHQYLVLY